MTTSRRETRRREILVAAARVLAGREAAGMAEVAAAAGIERGTLYRYFPTRDALDFIVLLRERRPPEPGFTAPLAALLERGREGGQINNDVPLVTLVESLLAIVGACVRTGSAVGMGSEDMSSTALRLFLSGARPAGD